MNVYFVNILGYTQCLINFIQQKTPISTFENGQAKTKSSRYAVADQKPYGSCSQYLKILMSYFHVVW